jgi:CDP-diglyceride synthetase
MSDAGTAPPASKRSRILRRTAVGSLLAAAVVAVLLLAAESESGRVVSGVGLALSALACLELARMGSFARRGWAWVLAPCWGLSLALAWHTLRGAASLREAGDDLLARSIALSGEYEPALVLEVVCVALLAVTARGVVDAVRARDPLPTLIAAAVTAWVGWCAYLFLSHVRPEIGLNEADFGLLGLAAVLFLAALVAWYVQLVWARDRMLELVRAAWIAPLLVLSLPWMWHVWQRFDHGGLVALIVLAKVGDIAGYYVGSAIGKRHPFPGISPGKTVAGCWGSLVAGTLVGGTLVVVGLLPDGRMGLLGGCLAGATTNLAAQAGDLLESWIKRRAGVKDSGTWFGPSGGVLDLVDSLLLGVPVSLALWPWCLG